PAELLEGVVRALEPAFRIDHLVAATAERVVYHAWDRVLKRHVALYAHLAPDVPGRAWFLRETETLAALDHPTIRHVYAAAIQGSFAYRTTNWVEGESLADALRRGPRPIPTRSEEHTSELQSPYELVCRLLLEKKNSERPVQMFQPPICGSKLTSACTLV